MRRTATHITLVLTALVGVTSFAAEGDWQMTFGEDRADLVPTGRNPYFILEPDYELVLAGTDDGKSVELVIRVLDETKTVDGVQTRVVEERESVAGRLVEVSRNYFAISKKTSNVYYFGEETTLFGKDGTERRGEDSWEAGVNGASLGMIMPGAPGVGVKHYQEYAPGIAMDRAEVVSVTEEVRVPAGTFDGCLRVRETNPLEGDEKEYKLYAPGVGLLVDDDLKLVRYGPAKLPPPLPAIELPPSTSTPKGIRQAIEAGRKIQEGDYEAAFPLYREAWNQGVRTENSTYNAACAAAVTGHPDEAFVWLARAAEAGFRDAAHLEVDPDLDSLREDPRFAAFVKTVRANAERYDRENNAELRELVDADQAARQRDFGALSEEERRALWEKISADDTARRARVAEILAAGGAKTGGDYYAAALVYQHGDELDDYAKAREYAAKAVELGDARGRWLAAAAWDRWLVHAGYPQRFGTQYTCNPDCKLDAWDESTTDEERARWDVPPIEEAKRRTFGP